MRWITCIPCDVYVNYKYKEMKIVICYITSLWRPRKTLTFMVESITICFSRRPGQHLFNLSRVSLITYRISSGGTWSHLLHTKMAALGSNTWNSSWSRLRHNSANRSWSCKGIMVGVIPPASAWHSMLIECGTIHFFQYKYHNPRAI